MSLARLALGLQAATVLIAGSTLLSCPTPGGGGGGPAGTTPPTVQVSSTEPDPTGASPIPITITFSEPIAVGSFTGAEITVTGGTLGNFLDSTNPVFTAEVTPGGPPATVSVSIAAGVCQDRDGHPNTASPTLSRTYNHGHAPGSLDSSFTLLPGASNYLNAMAIRGDQKIVIAGFFTSYGAETRRGIALLNTNGTVDVSFAMGPGVSGQPFAIALQSDQKVLMGGSFNSFDGTSRQNMCRLNTNGTLDTGFGGTASAANNSVYAVAVQADGQILIGGDFTQYIMTACNRVARLNASNGSVDTTFDTTTGANDSVWALAIQGDGKVIVGGDFTRYNGTPRARLARLNTNGSLDESFDPGAGPDDSVYSIAIQPDGKILIGGAFVNYGGDLQRGVTRLNSNGSRDTTFNAAVQSGSIYSVAIQGDGKILIGGSFLQVSGVWRYHLARLASTGALDTAFLSGGGGAGDTSSGVVRCMAIQADGKIVLGGEFASYLTTLCGRVARTWY